MVCVYVERPRGWRGRERQRRKRWNENLGSFLEFLGKLISVLAGVSAEDGSFLPYGVRYLSVSTHRTALCSVNSCRSALSSNLCLSFE